MLNLLSRVAARLPKRVRAILRRVPLLHRLRSRSVGRPRLPGPGAGELRPVVHLPDWCRWDLMRQRPQALAAAFAKAGHEVYFVDPLEARSRRADGVNIVPSVAETPRSGVLLMVHFPPLRDLFERYEDPVVFYDIFDDLTIFDPDEVDLPASRRVKAHHPILVESADVVAASSRVLHDRHRTERSDLILAENGVDLDRFRSKTVRPPELPAGPIAGYHGAVAEWFDFALLIQVARSLPEWNFVLVGPVLPEAVAGAAEFAALGNGTLIGEQTADAVAAFVQAFDVGLVPFRITEMTEGVSPLKLFEYLAAGVPVVSTPLPAAVDSPSTEVAADAAGFAAAIRASDPESPRWRALADAEAEAASWAERLQPILDRLDELGLRRA